MKACLMKVNYDPRYTSSTFEDRFRITSGIYTTPDKKSTKKIKERISVDFSSNDKRLSQKEQFRRSEGSFKITSSKSPASGVQLARILEEHNQTITRSYTMPEYCNPSKNKLKKSEYLELERKARVAADKAIRNKKIFQILGPYNSLRLALRRRGWVERFSNIPAADKENEDVTEGDDKRKVIKPWLEDNGIYAIMSHCVRNCTPTFLFSVKSQDVDTRLIKSGQVVNHYGKAKHFTTKVGLSVNIRNVPWYENANPNQFFPRSYKLDEADERDSFIDDFRLTACVSLLKHFVNNHKNDLTKDTTKTISLKSLEMAISQCELFIAERHHEDLDKKSNKKLQDEEWDILLMDSYTLIHEGARVTNVTENMLDICKELIKKLQPLLPQYDLDGNRNVWILKPGAKSRGRGIYCFDKLHVILRSSEEAGEGAMPIVQKYIERPLLIHNRKFDIRQWFLVTDWNPLTYWFYNDCYIRFCSADYTLADFDRSIHLSNNIIQKGYSNNNAKLPDDHMWSKDEFIDYLRSESKEDQWKKKIVPAMKLAIKCSLLCSQELVESRKQAFELYGADFILTEDLQPWLLEINSSPTMAKNTRVTKIMVDNVLEDTLKVVLDRKTDKSCSTGHFELGFQQQSISQVNASTDSHSLSIQGRKILKPKPALKR
ncbi:DgyrCDS6084 [Dimorphilus gyrociliatus]|uniref:DgyrCDS6084 n=1 Tax=Dimorphilus gyrociliatus TaxID=2664684 RepID=A0A7I8VRS7_9ANNE|nr:DgyrCDS6084 [Dimorphilus gyrociliatus]